MHDSSLRWTARVRCSPAAHVLLAVGMLASCLGPSDSGPGCQFQLPPFDLFGAASNFRYVCPTTVGDAGADATPRGSGAGLPTIVGASDIACALPFIGWGALPTVAVGAPFALTYVTSGDAGGAPLVPRPSSDAFAPSTPDGFRVHLPLTAFLVWQGSEVVDFTNLSARVAVSLGFYAQDQRGETFPFADASPAQLQATAGVTEQLLAFPRDRDGNPLAGTVSCTFTSGDARLLTVTGQGIVAQLIPLAAGEVTVTVTCLGLQATADLTIAPASDQSGADAQTDGPEDDGDAEVDASSDAADASAASNTSDGSGE